MAYITKTKQKLEISSASWDIVRKELSFFVAGNIIWFHLCEKQHENSAKKQISKRSCDSEIPLLGIYPFLPKHKNVNLKNQMHTYVHCSTQYKTHNMETTQIFTNR